MKGSSDGLGNSRASNTFSIVVETMLYHVKSVINLFCFYTCRNGSPGRRSRTHAVSRQLIERSSTRCSSRVAAESSQLEPLPSICDQYSTPSFLKDRLATQLTTKTTTRTTRDGGATSNISGRLTTTTLRGGAILESHSPLSSEEEYDTDLEDTEGNLYLCLIVYRLRSLSTIAFIMYIFINDSKVRIPSSHAINP